ncbi:hypothetical protein BGZ63DRAFT_475770 [Mariannaea sp. PMI_226]|nr:hypothetical protein BGZ63DRAFT_475770 [Mariannaea sp. PMI_226]
MERSYSKFELSAAPRLKGGSMAPSGRIYNKALMTTPWASEVIVKEVLATLEIGGWTFFGVLVENRDPQSWDWLDTECLLWVFDDGQTGLRLWQDVHHPVDEIENIIGHYQSSKGCDYLAVKWKNRISPTWELEEDLENWADLITDYFMRYGKPDHC